jgi:general secretion pathway protein A
MYLAHYGLSAKPFSLSPDSKFLWLGENHKEALATLEYGILGEKGFLILTGEVGTGKTFLINALIDMINKDVIVARIADPDLEPLDFINLLSEEFGMDEHFESKGAFLIAFKVFLQEAHAANKLVLLIVDEAQRLDHEILEQIRLLSNIEMHHKKLINIFFVGQNEFNAILLDEKNKAVRQRIAASYHIAPLSERETVQYVQHRLKVAGAKVEIFTPRALRQVHSAADGYPRLINSLCDYALLTGYAAGVKTIGDRIIRECSEELGLVPASDPSPIEATPVPPEEWPKASVPVMTAKPSGNLKVLMGFALTVLLIFAGYYAYQLQAEGPNQWSIEDIAPKQSNRLVPEDRKAMTARLKAKNKLKQDQTSDKVEATKGNGLNELVLSTLKKLDDQLSKFKSGDDQAPLPDGKVVLFFELNSNELPEKEVAKLNRVVGFYSKHPDSQIVVDGYTDSRGDPAYNKRLSKIRADMIRGYFAERGIPESQIKTFGRGPQNPIADNETAEGRKKNQRVEISVKINNQ